MNSKEKLHWNNTGNNSSLSVLQNDLPEESKIGIDAKLNLMN